MDFIVERGYCFKHDRDYVQNDQYNDENVDELIPVGVTHDLRVQEAMNLFLGDLVHAELVLVSLKLENKNPFRLNGRDFVKNQHNKITYH